MIWGFLDPMSSSNPAAAQSPYALPPKKKSRKKWWILAAIIALLVIIGAVVGGVVGSRHSSSSSNNSANSSNGGSNSGANANGDSNGSAGAGSTATGANGNQDVYLAVTTDSEWMLPGYGTATSTSGYSAPTAVSSASATWPSDPNPPSGTASPRAHPRLIAPGYKWDALIGSDGLIAKDPYMAYWNRTIVNNASSTLNDPVQGYVEDGGLSGSGILDPARIIKLKVKNWAYAYRVTNNTAYADRVWKELQNAAGNGTESFGANDGTRWNPAHFLDVAEMTNAFAIGYDWLYDYWSESQREGLRSAIITYGLNNGLDSLNQKGSAVWWTGAPSNSIVNGNWNCVCNGGMTMGALAILGDDTSGIAEQILSLTVPNAKANCLLGVHDDGTWAETANYWYFGTTGAAEMVSALTTALGSDQGMMDSAPQWNLTSLFHMNVQGQTSLFNYGDHGPNKYSSTANSLLLWSSIFQQPRYALYQRDRYDSSEPWSMFWYDPSLQGAWWDGLPLDGYFPNWDNEWAASRDSWTNLNGNYWAMKAGNLQHHQTHGDIDIGDFVIDSLGQRWAGELGSGQYLSTGYFSSEAQDSDRWLYYRKRTEGQNTILLNYENQNVLNNVTASFGSTGEAQGPAPGWTAPTGSSAFFTVDMTNAYNGTSIKRGIRFVNNRQQFLVQDDISGANNDVMWRMHTNATVATSNNNKTATLTLGGETMQVSIAQGPDSAVFSTMQPVPFSTDPPVPSSTDSQQQAWNDNQPNDGVTVLVIDVPNGNSGSAFSLQVLFSPQYSSGSSSSYSPPNVPIDQWTDTSHNN